MAVIVFRCTDCDREIQIIEQPQGLETIGRCIVTNKCRGNLYRVDRKEDFAVGEFPPDVENTPQSSAPESGSSETKNRPRRKKK